MGLESLVLLHFLGNAFLRCYQLLVSPSIVAHLLRVEGAADTGFNIGSSSMTQLLPVSLRETLPEVLQNTLHVFALQECNLEGMVRAALWEPLKKAGAAVNATGAWRKFGFALGIALIGALALESGVLDRQYLAVPAALGMALASLGGFSQKNSVFKVWNAIGVSCLLAGCAIWLLRAEAASDVALFLTGVLPAWLFGIAVLGLMLKGENFADAPFAYRAMAETKPGLSLLLFFSFLGLVGFPISPAFIGIDLLLYHASGQHVWIVALIAVSFVINGIAAAGVFLRLCMGRPVEVRLEATEIAPESRLSPSFVYLQQPTGG